MLFSIVSRKSKGTGYQICVSNMFYFDVYLYI